MCSQWLTLKVALRLQADNMQDGQTGEDRKVNLIVVRLRRWIQETKWFGSGVYNIAGSIT